jgi:hypothetical protein
VLCTAAAAPRAAAAFTRDPKTNVVRETLHSHAALSARGLHIQIIYTVTKEQNHFDCTQGMGVLSVHATFNILTL